MFVDNLQNHIEYQGYISKVKVTWDFMFFVCARYCNTCGQYLALSKDWQLCCLNQIYFAEFSIPQLTALDILAEIRLLYTHYSWYNISELTDMNCDLLTLMCQTCVNGL